MTPEQLRRDEAVKWLGQARKDLNAAGILAASEPSRSVFHSQQAAEKSLKALLSFYNVSFRRTHDLDELGEQCVAIAPALAPAVAEVVDLTDYAVDFRYPGVQSDPDEEEALAALQKARSLYDQVCALPEVGSPPQA